MAVKIVRQQKSIALLGAPTSAGALAGGYEGAPGALRAAGLAERLGAAGFVVTDYGDSATHAFQTDDEHPRARNVTQVLAAIEELRPKVEVAVKSGALPIILGGDCSIVLAAIAGARRYYRNVSLIHVDGDADLSEPATTPSGSVEGMTISHVIGRGAPELVRFWGEPPLVREPEVALFGLARADEAEQQFLRRSSLRRYTVEDIARMGAAAAAEQVLDRVHARDHEFVLHLDLDVIAAEDFRSTNLSALAGLRFGELRQALAVFARQATVVAFSISAYNPDLDADGAAARQVIELVVEVMSPRLETPAAQDAAPASVATELAADGSAASALSASPGSAASDGQTPGEPSAPAASGEPAEVSPEADGPKS